jgi:hypothetical protein
MLKGTLTRVHRERIGTRLHPPDRIKVLEMQATFGEMEMAA